MTIIKFIKKIFYRRCEFADKCPLYEEDSFTCNNWEEPIDYCGKWKELENENNI